jgi:hypothetical protein
MRASISLGTAGAGLTLLRGLAEDGRVAGQQPPLAAKVELGTGAPLPSYPEGSAIVA